MSAATARAWLAAGLVVLGFAAAASAEMTREQALAALGARQDVERRRAGIAALGEHGLMADVPRLVDALHDPDRQARALAERSLWQVWSRSGDVEVDRLFGQGLEQMQRRDGWAAVATFSRIIARRPDFAEGWNKRATVYYLLGEYEKSLADCDEVIRRNPWHFGALSGYGMIYLELGQPERALDAFERALDLNPNLESVHETATLLRRRLIERRRSTL